MSMTFSIAEKTYHAGLQRELFSCVDGSPDINVSNDNGVMLLRAIGYPKLAEDFGGILDPQELADRCLTALYDVTAYPELDGGKPGRESRGEAGCLVIDCGVRRGYLKGRLEQILAIAQYAIDHGHAFVSVG